MYNKINNNVLDPNEFEHLKKEQDYLLNSMLNRDITPSSRKLIIGYIDSKKNLGLDNVNYAKIVDSINNSHDVTVCDNTNELKLLQSKISDDNNKYEIEILKRIEDEKKKSKKSVKRKKKSKKSVSKKSSKKVSNKIKKKQLQKCYEQCDKVSTKKSASKPKQKSSIKKSSTKKPKSNKKKSKSLKTKPSKQEPKRKSNKKKRVKKKKN